MYKTNFHGRRALWIAVGIMIMANVLTASGSTVGDGSDMNKVGIRSDVVSSINGREIPINNLIYETHPVTRIYQVYHTENNPVNFDGFAVTPEPGNTVCAVMCHYYKKQVSADFYPNINTSFDQLETFLGILSDRSVPWTNVTNPRIELWWNSSQLYLSAWDYFRKTTPNYYDPKGYANFTLGDFSPDKVEDGTYAVDIGARNYSVGYSVERSVANGGLITKSGYYTVNISVKLYEYTEHLGIAVYLDNRNYFQAEIQNWSANIPPGNIETDEWRKGINIGYGGPSYPAEYNLSVTYYVNKTITGNITYKPHVSVERQIQEQWNDSLSNRIDIKGKHLDINASFHSDNSLLWTGSEQFVRAIELQSINEVMDPYAEFNFDKDLVVETRNDSLRSGSYEKNTQYSLYINNNEDTSKTVLGEINFSVQADNITDVGWREYANWNEASAKWVIPTDFVIRENEGLGTNIITSYYEPGYLNVDINRWINQTVFNSEGYQLAKFNVTFKDKNFEWAWARIEANNQYGVDAFVVPGTFTNINNAPGNFGEWEHGIQFDFDKALIQTGVTYNFSVILRVRPNNQRAPPIVYKPGFVIGEGSYSSSVDGGKGQEVEIPSSMLPDHVSHVSASTNTSNSWLVRRQNHTIAKLQDVSDITGPHAEFNIAKKLVVETENDSIGSGNYERPVWYGLNIYNEDDDSDTTLGDIRFSAQADNITWAGWVQYAIWNSSSANWSFPPDFLIRENEGFGAGFDTNYSESMYLGVNVSRWMNRTTFNGDGYQRAIFGVTFLNKEFEGIWGNIDARDLNGVDISVVPGTFTFDAPINGKEEKLHEINFNLEKGRIQTGIRYNFSVIIRVNNTRNLPVLFKPEFTLSEELSYNSTSGVAGYSIEMPTSMLPEHVSRASASTNISNGWKVGQSDQHIARLTGDRTAPVITDFKVSPNKSVGRNNPAVGSAYIFDENLLEVTGAVVDINNLVSSNRTILSIFVNQSGLNGYYVSPPWHGNSWNITNGSQDEIVSAIYHDFWKDHIFVAGKFKKNAIDSEISAVLWFNKTSHNLSNITMMDFSATPLLIENGTSTFRPVTSKMIEDNKPPIEVLGSAFNLYDIGNPYNPKIVSSQVRSGTYGVFVRAVDLMGNENAVFADIGVSNGQNPVADCGTDKLKCENVNSLVQLNGSASYDPDGTVISYYWDFGDGANGTGLAPKHAYSTYRWNGTAYQPFIVNLIVTDNQGLTNSTSQKVILWIAGDANGDGKVNILDASIVGLKWNIADQCADLNNDGKVNILDASIIGLNWNKKAEKNM